MSAVPSWVNLPFVHSSQDMELSAAVNPDGQDLHTPPLTSLYLPAAQLTHFSLFECAVFPKEHFEQDELFLLVATYP